MARFTEVDLVDLVLPGPRLILRPWRPDDAPAVVAAMRDPEIHRWLQLPFPYRDEDAHDYVSGFTARARAEGSSLECALELAESGALVGAAALRLPAEGHPHGDIGYWVAPDHRGRGYSAEAVRVLSRWGLDAGLDRVEVQCDARNVASAATALAAGFRFEGVLRCRLRAPAGDAAVFARLSSDTGEPIPAQFPRLRERGLRDGTVTLRALLPEDEDEYAEQERDPLTIATGFTGTAPDAADLSRTCARAGLEWLVGPQARLTLIDDATGGFAGSVQIRLAGPPQVGGIGYVIHPAFRGRGYTARALRLLTPWAFGEAGFTRLELGAKRSNIASQRAAEGAGFHPDGVRAARLRNPDGSFSDEVRYALVNPAARRARDG